jgi:CheY-like chemotaxis protein
MAASPFRSVLYVDDDPDICEVVKTTLRCLAGLDVETATSGEEAIDRLFATRADLVLMDVMMPGLDGPSTLGRIKESAVIADIPVIFLTAKVLPEEVARFLALGAIGVIEKPFDPLTLCDQLFSLWNAAHCSERRPAGILPRARAQGLEARFLARLDGDIARLEALIEAARQGDRGTFVEIERISHSIHGAGAMFGFASVSVAGARIERSVKLGLARMPAPGSAREAELIDELAEGAAHLAVERRLAGRAETTRGAVDRSGVTQTL